MVVSMAAACIPGSVVAVSMAVAASMGVIAVTVAVMAVTAMAVTAMAVMAMDTAVRFRPSV